VKHSDSMYACLLLVLSQKQKRGHHRDLGPDDIFLNLVKYNYGMGATNPVVFPSMTREREREREREASEERREEDEKKRGRKEKRRREEIELEKRQDEERLLSEYYESIQEPETGPRERGEIF